MPIPGALVALFTFPGVILHELAHKLFCDWTGVQVREVKYFHLGNVLSFRSEAAGWVIHEAPSTWAQTFWISVGPLVVNSLTGMGLGFLYAQAQPDSFLAYLLGWISISAGMHAFPSDQDATNVLARSQNSLSDGGSFFHYLSYPFFWIIWLANKLRRFWFDLLYAFVLFTVGSFLWAPSVAQPATSALGNTFQPMQATQENYAITPAASDTSALPASSDDTQALSTSNLQTNESESSEQAATVKAVYSIQCDGYAQSLSDCHNPHFPLEIIYRVSPSTQTVAAQYVFFLDATKKIPWTPLARCIVRGAQNWSCAHANFAGRLGVSDGSYFDEAFGPHGYSAEANTTQLIIARQQWLAFAQ